MKMREEIEKEEQWPYSRKVHSEICGGQPGRPCEAHTYAVMLKRDGQVTRDARAGMRHQLHGRPYLSISAIFGCGRPYWRLDRHAGYRS